MQRNIILTLALSLLTTGTVMAYDEQRDDGFRDPTKRNGQIASKMKLDNAIKLRQRNYMMEKMRDNAQKNIKNQWLRHTLSKAEAGVDTTNSKMNRSGELANYEGRRHFTYSRITVPNNAKRNFRSRAYDYYIEGGDAGAEAMESDVVLSSEHSPIRRSYRSNNRSTADIIASIRAMQKSRQSTEQVPTGQQKMTFRTGDSQRNFLHPYMDFGVGQ